MPDKPVEMTPEQAEQRETLIKMGHLPSVIDRFEPHEFGWVIQEGLIEDIFPHDEDEGAAYDPEVDPNDPRR
jgi:hypothetical protein